MGTQAQNPTAVANGSSGPALTPKDRLECRMEVAVGPAPQHDSYSALGLARRFMVPSAAYF